MSRISKFLMFIVLIVFILACNFIPQQVKDIQNLAGTAEAIATSLPLETVQSLASAIPLETIQAGIPTDLPNLEDFNYFDPQGTPLSDWNEIPIMPQAVSGEEFNDSTYSFKVNATVLEVQDYYNNEMIARGWSSTFSLPGDESGAVMLFSKESSFLTITVTSVDGETVVVLTM